MRYIALALLIAAPAAFAFTLPSAPSLGLEPGSMLLLCSGIAGVFAIRRRGR